MHQRSSKILLALAALSAPLPAHDGDPKLLDRQPAYMGPGWRAASRLEPGGRGLVASSPAIGFASSNVELLAWLSLPDFGITIGGNGNSCFGYTSPSGREYALMGLSNATAIVEVTQPGSPQIVAQIPGPTSLWRDVRVFSHYAYAVSEGGAGIQVIDLANVDAGTVVLSNTITTGGALNTHTVSIDVDAGWLVRAGGSGNGLRIYDLNADPLNPAYLGGWFERYVHEAQVVTYPTAGPGGTPRTLAIACGGFNNGYTDTGVDVVDLTNPASPVLLQHVVYPSAVYSHQAVLSPDRQWLFHNDEIDGLPWTRVFDASALGTSGTLTYSGYFVNGVTVDHNITTRGSYVFDSNYRSGLRVFDTSSGVLTPTLAAWFDTYPADDLGGYNGLWNNYPEFASGVVIGSDIEKGMFVWWIGAPAIQFAFESGRPDAISPQGASIPVRVTTRAGSAVQPGSLELWRNSGAGWVGTPLAHVAGEDYLAVFPPLACGTRTQWYVSSLATNGVPWSSPSNAPTSTYEVVSALGATLLADETCETANGWVGSAIGDDATIAGRWTRGDPLGTGAQPDGDVDAAGAACWYTGQGSEGAPIGDADVDGGRTTLVTRAFDLSQASDPYVSYWRWYSNGEGPNPSQDVFRVDVSRNDGAQWTNVETVGPGGADCNGGWILHQFRLRDFLAPSTHVRLRFVAEDAGSDSLVEAAIDALRVFDASCASLASFCAGDDTGSACPCGNAGAAGAGCANSFGAGARLAASGTPSLANDTLVLSASQLPANGVVLFFQGTAPANNGLGTAFGDGLRCVAGTVVRLGTHQALAGDASFPSAGDAAISVAGSVPAGAPRWYQAWYRNAAEFCTSATFNLSNGVAASWVP